MPLKKLDKPVKTRATYTEPPKLGAAFNSSRDLTHIAMAKIEKSVMEAEERSKERLLSQEEKSVWAAEAKRLGLPVPEDLKEAVRFRTIVLSEERQMKMKLEREVITRCRLPTSAFDMMLTFLTGNMTRELNTVRVIFEDMPDIPEPIKFILRAKAREWVEKVLTTLSTLEIDEYTLTPTGLTIKDVTNGRSSPPTQDSPSSEGERPDDADELVDGLSDTAGSTETGLPSFPGRDRTAVEVREQAFIDDDEVIVE